MAEIVIGLLGPAIELGKCFVAPIKRQFIYLCCFNSNVESLHKEASKLEDERAGLQKKVEEDIHDAREIYPKVTTWLKEVNLIQQKKSELDKEINEIRGSGCLSVKSRYSTSRRVVKTAEAMKQKREDRTTITDISHPRPPSDTPGKPMSEFESRKKIEDDLMVLLKDEEIKMLGLCGMGGVGKTTLAKKIENRAMKENVYGESVMVVVSQPVDKMKIQGEIAENLRLKLKETSLSGRAQRLRSRLSGGKRILIILDDVWKHLDLEELGLPCESGAEGCTILLTSRNRSVFTSMDVNEANILGMKILTEDEAWFLFKEKQGSCGDDETELSSLARKIANECKGLPLALVIVAGALKDEKKTSAWRSALQQLMSSNPQDLSEVLQDVYIPIKLSYDYLSSQNSKSIFLLCSLFPEDSNISLQILTFYAMGLRIFEDIKNLEQARDRIEALVGALKSHFLLLEGLYTKEKVRMHDVIRDAAIFIASKEERLIKCGYDSTWISPFVGGESIEICKGSTFPNLRLLMIEESANKELLINDISFEGMKELNVLSVSNSTLTSLPLTTQNLVTLILVECLNLKTISVVGGLFNLEVLICDKCDAIEEFPSLTQKGLRHLEISKCKALKRIGLTGVTSCGDKNKIGHESGHITIKFQKLEYLRLWDLPNLKGFNQGNESIEFPLLTQLDIGYCPQQLEGLVSSNQRVSFGNLRKLRLVGITKCENVWSQIPFGSFSHLEKLDIRNCRNIKSIFSFSTAQKQMSISNTPSTTFPKLISLRLLNLPGLTNICKGVESIESPLPLLTKMAIYGCPNLKSLFCGDINSEVVGKQKEQAIYFTLSIWDQIPIGNLTGLESLAIFGYDDVSTFFSSSVAAGLINLWYLKIGECKNMVKVIAEEVEDYSHETTLLLPRLKVLRLDGLPELKIFCEWKCALHLPALEKVGIYNCSKMDRFSLGPLTTPNLKTIELDDKQITITRDLNNVLMQHFIGQNERGSFSGGQMNPKIAEIEKVESTSNEKIVDRGENEKSK